MENLALFGNPETTTEGNAGMPDPQKYSAERGACNYPHLLPSTAYSYGCRCKGCYKYHSAERYRRASGPMPCAYPDCPNPRRRVQRARYCEDHATSKNYRNMEKVRLPHQCCVCGQVHPIDAAKRYKVCPSCHDVNGALIQQASTHRVSEAQLIAMIKSRQCALCEKAIYLGRGSSRSAFTIDHDHRCCPGGRSCGGCVRGLLCSACNMSLGHVESMLGKATLDGLVTYLGHS